MVNKSMRKNKRAASTITMIFLALLLGFVIINSYFALIQNSVTTYNATLSEQTNDSFTSVFESQQLLEDNINGTKESVKNIKVQSGVTQFIWNSFQGLGSILRLPLTLINVGVNSVAALIFGIESVPVWSQNLLIALIAILITLAIIAAMTGGNPNI